MDKFEELKKFIKEYQAKSFKEHLKENNITERQIKHFDNFGTIKSTSIDEKNRTIEVVATKEVVDRQGDIIRIAGIDVNDFIKNPVVPFGHKYQDLPVAKAIGLKFDGDKLIIKLQFPPKEIYELGDTVFKLFKAGYLNAVSIGFIPIKETWDDEIKANVIEKSELLEVSIVPVPANQDALIKAFKKDDDGVSESYEDRGEDFDLEQQKETQVQQKEIIKKYRKYQVLLRDALGINATEDEAETVDKVMKAALSVLDLVKKSVIKTQENQGANPRGEQIEPRPRATRSVKARTSLVGRALKVADKL